MYHRPSVSSYHTVHGLRLHVRRWAAPGRPKILLLHGWMDCGAGFQFLADRLPEYDLYAPDWRGFGGSEHQSHGHYDRAMMMADLHALGQIISPEAPLHLLGHSMGGMIAAHYAGALSERVGSLVVAEGFGIENGSIADSERRSRHFLEAVTAPNPPRPLPGPHAVATKLQKRNPHLTPEQAAFLADALTERADDGRLYYRADPKHHIPQPQPYRLSVVRHHWQHIRAPVLWVEGGPVPHNHYLNMLGTELSQRHQDFGRPQRVCIPHSGHMLQWEAPQELADAARLFWQQCGLSAPG